mmetsp:Transcript_58938/g.170983  ORF Transcript_58938/g.170983 Transcript_58938/m.170983 type:complete len:248 (-) Transcript_58938:2138-2881(-)
MRVSPTAAFILSSTACTRRDIALPSSMSCACLPRKILSSRAMRSRSASEASKRSFNWYARCRSADASCEGGPSPWGRGGEWLAPSSSDRSAPSSVCAPGLFASPPAVGAKPAEVSASPRAAAFACFSALFSMAPRKPCTTCNVDTSSSERIASSIVRSMCSRKPSAAPCNECNVRSPLLNNPPPQADRGTAEEACDLSSASCLPALSVASAATWYFLQIASYNTASWPRYLSINLSTSPTLLGLYCS